MYRKIHDALDSGAIGSGARRALDRRCVTALDQVAASQAKYQMSPDPALRFLLLLRVAMRCGRAHVADRLGRPPADAGEWGWQRTQKRRGWAPHGMRIGWITGSDLFLEPTLSYQSAQELAGTEPICLSEQALRRRLRERNLLASTDSGRQMLLVRRTLEGH